MKKTVSLFLLLLTIFSSASGGNNSQGRKLHELLLSQMAIEDVHPDSLDSNIQQLKAQRLLSTDAAERAVYAAAIGRLYAERMYWRSVGTDLRDSSLCWYGKALADKEVLARTPAKQWKPFVVVGKDEHYFGGDMLNVVWRSLVGSHDKSVRSEVSALPTFSEMIDFYRSRGIREGALLLAMDSLDYADREVTKHDWLRLRDEYADLPLCAEVYLRLSLQDNDNPARQREWLQQGIDKYPDYPRIVALQNALTRLSDPNFRWNGPTHVYPGKAYKWTFTARNIQSVSYDGKEYRFAPHDAVETFTDSVMWTAPTAVGEHEINFSPHSSTTNLTDKIAPLQQKIRVSTLQAVYQTMPDGKVRILVLDAESGRPQPGVTVTTYRPVVQDGQEGVPYFSGTTDSHGKVSVPRWGEKNKWEYNQLHFRMSRAGEENMPIAKVYLSGENRWSGAPSVDRKIIRLFTDRSIYRPGQSIHVGGIAYQQLDWEGTPVQAELQLELIGADGKSLALQTVSSDAMGVFSADFELPADCRNGYLRVKATQESNTGQVGFRVEEYKRPTFEVVLDDSLRLQGDSVVILGFARNYDGSPLRNARVTGTFQWSRGWFAMPVERVNPAQYSVMPLDTMQTDADGRFRYALAKLQKPSLDNLSLLINVDVLSPHGESQHASHNYLRRLDSFRPETEKVDSAFIVSLPDKYFSATKPGRIEVTSNLSDVYLHYTLTAAGQVWVDTMMVFSGSTLTLDVPYRAEYDQSATASFCFVKGEKVYTTVKTLYLEQPDNQLKMRWDTFRNLLQPGQREEWKLTLLRPDGAPADASLMVTMYDASLDYFGRHAWDLDFQRGYRTFAIPYRTVWNDTFGGGFNAWYLQKTKKELPLEFTVIDPELFRVGAYTRGGGIKNMRMYKAMATSQAQLDGALMAGAPVAMSADAVAETEEEVDDAGSEETTITMPLRENFNETAFFYPALRTNAAGQVSISFTLPESLTRWTLLGVAHTADLSYLNLREDIEARKDLMAQLYLPRFLRPGDEAMLTAMVRNVSDEAQRGKGVLQILDARTEKVLKTWKADVRLASQQDTVLTFGYVSPESDIIVRWAVEGTTCSDGEQRLLPVLPPTMDVTNTVQLTAYDPSVKDIDLSGILPKDVQEGKLTIQYTTRPEQYALQALPALAVAKRNDVLSLTSAYYAGMLGKRLNVAMPDSTETYLSRIEAMQDANGAFSWFPGMMPSDYLTREVTYLLTRLRMLTGTDAAARVNEKAVHHLLTARIDSTHLTTDDLRTLYVALYSGVRLTKDEQKKVDFLTKLAKQTDLEDEGYERQALLAVVLKQAGENKKAEKCVSQFRKYLVSSPDRGTYIEFPKGAFTSIDRKLHIHVQLMEALQRVAPKDTLLRGMRRYLLQQKRTQEWSTPVNSANAVFALLLPMGSIETIESIKTIESIETTKDILTLKLQHAPAQTFTAGDDALGYLCDTVVVDARHQPLQLRLQKKGQGESWGAVYADFRQAYDKVESRSTGLSVRAEYPSGMKTGNRYKVRYYISADRDYEFVTLVVPRPAATEPVEQRPGCRWASGLSYYRQVHDATAELCFSRIPRGDYLIEEDIYVERNGSYHTGVAVIRCDYAEEFQGHSADGVVEIK